MARMSEKSTQHYREFEVKMTLTELLPYYDTY